MQVIFFRAVGAGERGHLIDRSPSVALQTCLVRTRRPGGGELIRLGHPLLDAYLDLVTARARPNTVIATAFDLKVFFTVIDKEPGEVVTVDVLALIPTRTPPRCESRADRGLRAGVVRTHDQAATGDDRGAL